jgi:glycosyltransferase involved in cell wall biosynthesis
MLNPRLSIITPTYNAEQLIERCIDSVVALNDPYVEHVVVDGCSTDGTLDRLRESSSASLRWISESDSGIYDAMNKGVGLARGDWLLFLGADDQMARGASRLVRKFRGSRTIYYGNVFMPGKRAYHAGPFTPERICVQNICHQAIFYPRSVFDVYRYSLRYPRGGDWLLNIQLYGDRRFKFRHIPTLIAAFEDREFKPGMEDSLFQSELPDLIGLHLGARLAKRKPLLPLLGILAAARIRIHMATAG